MHPGGDMELSRQKMQAATKQLTGKESVLIHFLSWTYHLNLTLNTISIVSDILKIYFIAHEVTFSP